MSAESFGRYRLESRIGQGGMGEVFRAIDTSLNRPVAIKVMRKTAAGHEAAVQRFIREARAASALNHPNIVIIHEIGETAAGDHFIVQELIDGRTLRSMLDTALPMTTVASIGSQLARALAAAHASAIVHRDVKPENIMIRGDGYVKMLDFGLARLLEAADGDESTRVNLDTLVGTVVGTPAYLSPEQAMARTVGPQADIFALGIVLYEMAAGRRPFFGATTLALVTSIATEQPVPPSRVVTGLPQAFDDLVLRMLEKSPERRPSALEVEQAIVDLSQDDREGGLVPAVRLDRPATVGRDTERATLRRAYVRAREGRSLFVAVTGEPGIGKTSLVEDLVDELARSGERAIVARGRCSESLAGSEAYLPILEALDSLLHRSSGPSLSTVIRTLAPTWNVQVSTHSTVSASVDTPPPAPSPERMKRELGSLLQELSRHNPLVVIIEDLHWADVSTVDILNYLAGRFADMRVLIVATYRPSDMALARHAFLGIVTELQSKGVFQEIGLGFLPIADVERYLDLQFPGHQFPLDFGGVIHAKTDGSPLFMADLVRYLHDTGGIVQEGGVWVLARALPDVPKDLPQSVRGMIARKIEQVGDENRKILLAASAQGHEFDSTTIGEALEMDAAEVEERLETLERVHVFVRREAEAEFPDRTLTVRYQFVHVLYQNVLFASLQPTRRVALSGRVARALVAHHGTEVASIAGRLAVLFETARDFAVAAQYFYLAAQRAVPLFAFREALTLAERGLDGLRGLPEGVERRRLELGLQMMRGLALRSVKGWAAPELEQTFVRARQICQELEDPPEIFPVLWNIAFFNMIKGYLPLVREQVATLMSQAETAHDATLLMAVQHIAGVTAEFGGDVVESRRLLDSARDLHVPAEHRRYTSIFGIDPGMVARTMSSRPLWALGYPDQALARALETVGLARAHREPVALVFALIVASGIHAYRGEIKNAVSLADEVLALCREYEFPQEAEWGRAFRGAALVSAGRIDEGVADLQRSLRTQEELRTGLVRTMWLSLLADGLLLAGRIDEGLRAVANAFDHAERTVELGFVHELHRVRGELRWLGGDVAGAEKDLRAAVAHARSGQARAFELRAAMALTRLLDTMGRGSEGAAELEPVYDWFTEGLGTADLRAARELLSNP